MGKGYEQKRISKCTIKIQEDTIPTINQELQINNDVQKIQRTFTMKIGYNKCEMAHC